jgi:hypothetical protein
MLERSALLVGMQMLGGAVVGGLLPRHWYVSAAAAWGSLFWFALRPTAILEPPAARFPEDQIHPSWVPLVALLLTAASGYIAARVRGAVGRHGSEGRRASGGRP